MKNFKISIEKQSMDGRSFLFMLIPFSVTILFIVFMQIFLPHTVSAADRLIVKNDSGTATFRVEDEGYVFTNKFYSAQSGTPGFWLDETGTGNKSAFLVLDNKWLQIQRRDQGFGGYEASPLFLNLDAPSLSIFLGPTGNVGFGVAAQHPLDMANGAYVTVGGVWTDASSREYKQEIKVLTRDEALDALTDLQPVKFSYRVDPKEKHVGFIAEDVPELVASSDRKGMSSMDVVAVLTKVVQEQQKTIAELSRKVAELTKK